MKTKLFKKIEMIILMVAVLIAFTACSVDITVQQNKNGSVSVKLNTGAGEAFTKMILAATGGTSENLFDTKEIQYELAKTGFSDVKVESEGGTQLSVNLTDAKKSSYLFTSGILSDDKNGLKMNLTATALKKFYDMSDEQTQMVLDLLVAPVFDGEKSTQEEYLEMVAAFYGDSAAKEIQDSIVNITFINADGSKNLKKLPMIDLLTLNN